jgi:predicted nucleic acid-binding Zn ribbon protein
MDNEISISAAMQMYLKRSGLKGKMLAMYIASIWEKIVGKAIANYTQKIEIINGTLIIHTNVAVLKTELLYQKSKIIQLLNEELKEEVIKDVIVK